MYDLVAFGRHLYPSYYISAKEAARRFPMMSQQGLKGCVVYFDGQMDDARMNVSLALTAATKGATVVNHMSVESLIKDDSGKVVGVNTTDNITGAKFNVFGKVVVNACGPFVDSLCHMANENHIDLIMPAQGTHVLLPDFYAPKDTGLIVPKTKDGRVLFMLPWNGHALAGTTDEPVELTDRPHARSEEVQFILTALNDFLSVEVRPEDVLSVWAGIRPLARDPTKTDTQSLSRSHVIMTDASGMVTVTGGKWTTYRRMAEDTVDEVVKVGNFKVSKCTTEHVQVVGAEGWDHAMFTQLSQKYRRLKTARGKESEGALSSDIGQHLSHAYGTRAFRVAELSQAGYGEESEDNGSIASISNDNDLPHT
eukprot:c17517_g1_i2.p1 GENE.c17517_g1_i2~~c17517_g1_i2.p1  ORF type:complete len:367 (+),score=82.77 c17517_g1_i2:223-1323(+)